MTARDAVKTIQTALGFTGANVDGILGPHTRLAFDALAVTPPDAAWPPTATPAPSGVMSQAFIDFLPFIFEWEGTEFENDPNDPGGATKFGIDQRSHPSVDIRNLTTDEATAIYWSEWIRDRCDVMASPMAEVFFNCAVNMGLARAHDFSMGLKPAEAGEFLNRQEAYYRQLGASPKYAMFLKGWLNRTEALRKRFNI